MKLPVKIASIAALLSCFWLLSSCQTPSGGETAARAPQVEQKHAHALVYQLDEAQSSIVLKVYRDGPLARFGHNHVIVATGVSGKVYREQEWAQSDVELTLPVAKFEVDNPTARARAGADFPGELSALAVASTRQNMLGPKLLAAEQYPTIALNSIAVSGQAPDLRLTLTIKVREFSTELSLPVHIEWSDDSIVADGQLTLSQTQLGLAPFSVLGGGLRVRDGIDAQYHLVARRASK